MATIYSCVATEHESCWAGWQHMRSTAFMLAAAQTVPHHMAAPISQKTHSDTTARPQLPHTVTELVSTTCLRWLTPGQAANTTKTNASTTTPCQQTDTKGT